MKINRLASANERYKSAITDHVCQNNHIMDWEASEIVEQESDKFKRWVKESIHIRMNSPTMNRDEGAYQLYFFEFEFNFKTLTSYIIILLSTLTTVNNLFDGFTDADRLAQLVEHRTTVREVVGSNPGRTNTQGL